MFTFKKPVDRIGYLLTNITNFKKMYYGVKYATPIISRYGTITSHTHSIRECTYGMTHDCDVPKYELHTYANMYDWLDGADTIHSLTLWLEAIQSFNTALHNTSERVSRKHHILVEMPDEAGDIITTLTNIVDECINLK